MENGIKSLPSRTYGIDLHHTFYTFISHIHSTMDRHAATCCGLPPVPPQQTSRLSHCLNSSPLLIKKHTQVSLLCVAAVRQVPAPPSLISGSCGLDLSPLCVSMSVTSPNYLILLQFKTRVHN